MTTITCAPAEVLLCVYQGDTAQYRFTLLDAGAPADLTGMIFLMQIRRSWADTSAVAADLPYTKQGNVVTFTLSGEISRYLPSGMLRWDVQMSDPEGIMVATFARGPYEVAPEVSRVE
jgi:hypothetical protein